MASYSADNKGLKFLLVKAILAVLNTFSFLKLLRSHTLWLKVPYCSSVCSMFENIQTNPKNNHNRDGLLLRQTPLLSC